TNLTANVAGSTLTLSWTAPAGPVTGYVLEAGSAPGLANIGAATIGANTSFVIPGVPAGAYYVRARAITSAGSGAPSNDVVVVVP
ncbi:MAG: fibronectin type III domain-containing protein, partial [Acidobacteria bacterium]|nr:fibronectin type III domain-containing protein [Acidobacteriota bacterium]